MDISVREIREYLIPKLCALLLECKRCNRVREEIQAWVDDKLKIEDEKENRNV